MLKLGIFLLSFLTAISLGKKYYGYSTYCQPCISACEKNGTNEFTSCKTYSWNFQNEVFDWDYCSTSSDIDYMGRTCSSACAFFDEAYQWCSTGTSWGYCSEPLCASQAKELPDYGYSTFCQSCITPCEQIESPSYWCGTKKWLFNNKTWTWDYCSPNSGVDFQGNICLDKCMFNGKDYQSCSTEEESKGYCTGKGNVLCDFLPAK